MFFIYSCFHRIFTIPAFRKMAQTLSLLHDAKKETNTYFGHFEAEIKYRHDLFCYTKHMHALLTTIGLGIAGIDPFAAVALLAAIAAGVSRRKVLAFFFSMLAFTVAGGVVLSLGGDAVIRAVTSGLRSNTSPIWIYVNLTIIMLLISWLACRWYRHVHPQPAYLQKPKRKLGGSVWQFALAGVAYSFIGALSDVTFYATVAVAAQTANIAAIIGLHTLWFILGQCMLVAAVIAYLVGAHHTLVAKSKLFWRKYKHYLPVLLHTVAGLVILILLADIILFLASGKYLF